MVGEFFYWLAQLWTRSILIFTTKKTREQAILLEIIKANFGDLSCLTKQFFRKLDMKEAIDDKYVW